MLRTVCSFRPGLSVLKTHFISKPLPIFIRISSIDVPMSWHFIRRFLSWHNGCLMILLDCRFICGKQMGMACIPMSGRSLLGIRAVLVICTNVSACQRANGYLAPHSSSWWIVCIGRCPPSFADGHLGEQVCTKTKFLILVRIAKKKWVILLPLLIATFLCLRRKTNPRINIWLGWPILCWSPPHVGGGTSIPASDSATRREVWVGQCLLPT